MPIYVVDGLVLLSGGDASGRLVGYKRDEFSSFLIGRYSLVSNLMNDNAVCILALAIPPFKIGTDTHYNYLTQSHQGGKVPNTI